jgi:hypothetical protein
MSKSASGGDARETQARIVPALADESSARVASMTEGGGSWWNSGPCIGTEDPPDVSSGWSLRPLADGWVEVQASMLRGTLYVRFVEVTEGHLSPVDIVMLGTEAMDYTTLRNIPMRRIEATVNLGDVAPWFLHSSRRPDASAVPLRDAIERGLINLRLQSDEGDEAVLNAASSPRTPLTLPPGRDRPDCFYRKVAAAYRAAVREGVPPARLMAEEADVTTRTAQAWVAEARKRGYLPPAPPGREG